MTNAALNAVIVIVYSNQDQIYAHTFESTQMKNRIAVISVFGVLHIETHSKHTKSLTVEFDHTSVLIGMCVCMYMY